MKTYFYLTIIMICFSSTLFIICMRLVRGSGKRFWSLIFPVKRRRNQPEVSIINTAPHDELNVAADMVKAEATEALPEMAVTESKTMPAESETVIKQCKHNPDLTCKHKGKILNYKDVFLVNDGGRDRVSAYIDRDLHDKFKRLLSVAAPGITLTSFINNILDHHLEQHKDVLSEMYNDKINKPF